VYAFLISHMRATCPSHGFPYRLKD
jgi:hypothetical protein